MSGLGLLALFYLSTLITAITSFARTIALQTGKMALIKATTVPTAVSSLFTPDYTNVENIQNRECFKELFHKI